MANGVLRASAEERRRHLQRGSIRGAEPRSSRTGAIARRVSVHGFLDSHEGTIDRIVSVESTTAMAPLKECPTAGAGTPEGVPYERIATGTSFPDRRSSASG